MAPSQLQISVSALQRLLKEEASYYKEQEQQEARIAKLEKEPSSTDENHDYQLKQEVCFLPFPSPIPTLPHTPFSPS